MPLGTIVGGFLGGPHGRGALLDVADAGQVFVELRPVAGADDSGPIQPDVRALDSLNPRDTGIQKAQAGGLTTVNIMPGSGHLLSGQTVYVKLRDGRTVDDLLITNADGSVAGGIKMANGTNPQRQAPFAGTRGKAAALMRAQLHRAHALGHRLSSSIDRTSSGMNERRSSEARSSSSEARSRK